METPAAPLYFGPAAAPLFGWFHPAAGRDSALGVVLCNPFHYEAMGIHATYRALARHLASLGIPALRFDYPGTGDSSGADDFEGWLDGIERAIDELERRSGVREVALFGVRLGATLATLAAARRSDVSTLVLFAPLLTGKAFLREMRMVQATVAKRVATTPPESIAGASALAPPAGGTEILGYRLAPETVTRLEAVDLEKVASMRVARALVLQRDDLPGEDKVGRHLGAIGVGVTTDATPGYAAMMQDAMFAEVPTAAIARIGAWLRDAPPRSAPAPSSVRTASATARVDGVQESAIAFGPRKRLFGILSEPAHPRADHAVLFLNVAANHRVGPNRMVVRFSRALAAQGVGAFRFDIAGVGDSETVDERPHVLYSKAAVADVRAAMDAVEAQLGVKRFALVGLCSGAFLAFHTALADARVTRQVLLNLQAFRWKPGDSLDVAYRSVGAPAEARAPAWRRLLRGEVNVRGALARLGRAASHKARARVDAGLSRLHVRSNEPSVLDELRAVLDRGVATTMIYGASDGGIDLLEAHAGPSGERARSSSERDPRFTLTIVEGPDHTFTPAWSQAWLEREILLACR